MTQSKIKLLHVALDMGIGGLQRLIAEMAMAMHNEQFSIEVCCFDRLGQFAEILQKRGIRVTLLQKNQNRFDPLYPFRLMRFLRQNKIDILHMHSGTFLFGSVAGWLANTPATIYTDHGRFLIEPRIRLIEDRISGLLIDRIIAVSGELEKYLVEKVHLPADKICTVINGIRTTEFSRSAKPERLRDEFKISDSCKVIGTVGRLDGVKDQLTMIKAFQIVHSRIPDSKLFIVGDGPMREELSEFIMRENLGDLVVITGERKDIPDILSFFDIFFLSSLSEGTSIALLEAMASGLPSVVTDVGGNPAIIDNNIDGILVKTGDIKGMGEEIVNLLKDDARYKMISNNAFMKVKKEYSLERMIENYTEIYLELLKRKRKFRKLLIQEK